MVNKSKTFLKWMKDFGFGAAVELGLFQLGLKNRAIFEKKLIFNYPNSNLKIEIDQGPIDFWKSLEQGNWEIELIKFIQNLVKPGEIILDVGAWIGPLTFLFSYLIGKNGKVHSFEPNPESFSILEHYATNNNKTNNIYLHNTAISNVVGSITLYSPSQIDRSATIQRARAGVSKFKYEWKCDGTTIDEFCLSRDMIPNGIKIDVEGAEEKVLNGAIKIIEKYHPWCLFEFHGSFLSEFERRKIWSFITERAEKIIYIEGDEDYLIHNMEVPFNFKPTKRANYCIFFK